MKVDFSSLLALKLETVLKRLEKKGFKVEMTENAPPGKKAGIGDKRVIAIRQIRPARAEIIWSYERYR